MGSILSSDRFARILSLGDRLLLAALAPIPLGYFVLMVIGLVRWYSPVPFWDMWDGYLSNYIQFQDSDWRELFLQTNEHRIWFSNALFYLDIAHFGGRSLFLIPMNVLLAICIWFTLALIARRLLRDRPDLWPVVALGLGPLCFSWLQEQNLSWGFQSSFFVAYLFPLAAFSCLAASVTHERGWTWFVAAILLGLASLGTMANGLLVLPLLLAMIVVAPNPSWGRAAAVLVIGAVAIVAWFHGYYFIERDRASFSQIATFILTFFGHPVAAMFSGNKTVRYVAGGFFIAATLGFALRWVRTRRTADPMALALLAFLGYVGASCAVISFARATIESDVAFVSRYATPSLIAWAALILLFAHSVRHLRFARAACVFLVVGLAYGLWPSQRKVYGDVGPEMVHLKAVGALALKLNVQDRESIGQIYPTDGDGPYAHVRHIARLAGERKLSIMADPGLAAAAAGLGKPAEVGFHPCAGALDQIDSIKDEQTVLRASGWAFDDAKGMVPSYAFLAVGGVIEGVAATGRIRRDIVKAEDERAVKSGFTGFVQASAAQPGVAIKIYCAD